MSNPCIYEISIKTFLDKVCQNIGTYATLREFWLPLIEARAKRHPHWAEDCLLNPIFLWCYVNREERLTGLESELNRLRGKLGSDVFLGYQEIVSKAIVNEPTENQAHDKTLDTRAELRGMLHYAELGHSINLEPRQPGVKTHDFNASSSAFNIAVEAKFLRRPDTLRVYLDRWWNAAGTIRIISGTLPLGRYSLFPYIKFKWEYIEGDLQLTEIEGLKKFFRTVFDEPDSDKSLSLGRIKIGYSPNNKLPTKPRPLGTIEPNTKTPVDLLMEKIRKNIEEKAKPQLVGANKRGMQTACYLLISITGDIQFEWEDEYKNAKKTLNEEYRKQGLEILIEEVGYL